LIGLRLTRACGSSVAALHFEREEWIGLCGKGTSRNSADLALSPLPRIPLFYLLGTHFFPLLLHPRFTRRPPAFASSTCPLQMAYSTPHSPLQHPFTRHGPCSRPPPSVLAIFSGMRSILTIHPAASFRPFAALASLGSPASSKKSSPTNTLSSSPNAASSRNPNATLPAPTSRSVPDRAPSPRFTRRCWRIWFGRARLWGRGRGSRLMVGS